MLLQQAMAMLLPGFIHKMVQELATWAPQLATLQLAFTKGRPPPKLRLRLILAIKLRTSTQGQEKVPQLWK